ncbi:MAG TPA: prenyltransferase/squalene oxidase repeat-containing protein [Miltoncostaeaceae bacterium]|jgi:hypothetical protein|nr:prenyltransferase/squalene oxidase repeat-containing protein [Miltoncostaeaceae bacterium]
MAPRPGALALALGMVLAAPAPALAGPLAKALDHLSARQDPAAGGFAEVGGTDSTYSAWAALAVVGAGERAARWRRGAATLREAVAAPLRRPTLPDIELAAVAAAASGLDPRSAGGRNAVRTVIAAQRADGSIGDSPATTAWGILALRAGGLDRGARAVRRARAALVRQQNRDGGWSFGPESLGSGPNTTATAIQALWAAGARPEGASALDRGSALDRARGYLLRAQNRDGGFPPVVGERTQALTTAWVTVALHTIGEDPGRPPWSRSGGPVAALRSMQLANGGVRNERDSRSASIWATSQAALAFARGPLPLGPRRLRPVPQRAPRVLWREPGPGEPTRGALIVRYRDDAGGTGIDPSRVGLRVGGRDVTRRALVTPFALRLPPSEVRAGAAVRLALRDRAGNARTVGWRLAGGDR